MTLRLVVFDCDGTLVDSQRTIVASMEAAHLRHGLAVPSPEAVRRTIGLPLAAAVGVLSPALTPDECLLVAELYKEAYLDLRTRGLDEQPLYDGVAEAIAALDDAGILLGVATGKGRRGLRITLEKHGLTDRFVTLQTVDDAPGKPHPGMLLQAMREAGADPGSTIMIGDTTFDIEMAGNAAVAGLGVSWGYHAPDELVAAGAARVATAPHEIPALVEAVLEMAG